MLNYRCTLELRWHSDYTIEETKRDKRGTDVILHFDKDSEEFADESRIEAF